MNIKELLSKKLLNDEIVKDSFSRNDIERIAEIVEEFLTTETVDEKVCYDFYKRMKLPYSVVYRSFGLIKSEIRDEKLNKKLDKLLNITAKVYIKKEISSLKTLLLEKRKHDFMLFKAHEEWIDNIISSVKNDDLKTYPLIEAKNCKFSKYLSYLESLMICLDVNLCIYIHDLHNLIHTLANSFYIFYKKGYYAESYFVFRDLKEQVLKFYNTLNELYIATFSNVEKSFFELIEILVKSKTLYVAVIDLKSLKVMNSLINENTVTDAKLILYHKLHNVYKDKKNYLIIQGSSNDFYFIGIDIDFGMFEKEVENLYSMIRETIEINDEKINFDAVILGIKLDKYSQIQIKDLINYFRFLKKAAKKEHKNIILNNKENHLEEWIKNQINIKFIKKKIQKKEIDIMFQPIFKADNNEIFSLEVLGRINDGGKLIPAGMFIDHIYAMDKIAEFDMIVLDKILEKEHLIKQITERIFLNISFEALKNDDYIKKLNSIIQKIEVDIVLELTEQRFVENLELIENINKNTNSYFAVDDFGSGYSSILLVINLLRKNMIRVLKIDGTLVKGIKNDEYLRKAVKIIVGFRKEFNLHLVAEFVEDKETLEFLKNAGVDLLQGYYLSMPKTIEELLVEKEERIREIVN
ncbi:EAL domain-containing protein [Nautilia sp.]